MRDLSPRGTRSVTASLALRRQTGAGVDALALQREEEVPERLQRIARHTEAGCFGGRTMRDAALEGCILGIRVS